MSCLPNLLAGLFLGLALFLGLDLMPKLRLLLLLRRRCLFRGIDFLEFFLLRELLALFPLLLERLFDLMIRLCYRRLLFVNFFDPLLQFLDSVSSCLFSNAL